MKPLFTPKASAKEIEHLLLVMREAQKLLTLAAKHDLPVAISIGTSTFWMNPGHYYDYLVHANAANIVAAHQTKLEDIKGAPVLAAAYAVTKSFILKHFETLTHVPLDRYKTQLKERLGMEHPDVIAMETWIQSCLTLNNAWARHMHPKSRVP